MEKRYDILKNIYEKKINEKAAYDILDDILLKFHNGKLSVSENIYEYYLSLNPKEVTAILGHGKSFIDVSKWRYEGWPKSS